MIIQFLLKILKQFSKIVIINHNTNAIKGSTSVGLKYLKFERLGMAKWEVKKGAESMIITCANCDHIQANHFDTTKEKLILTKCSRCDCKEFKFKTKDKLKGFFQKD